MSTKYKEYIMRFKLFIAFFIILFSVNLSAEEGMWMLDNLPVQTLQKAGFQLSQDQIYDTNGPSWSDAVVQIGGGTGSFVSRDGLVVTNHHVAYDALQALSSDAHNYTRDGYEATARGEELYADGYKAYLALRWNDVTDQVLKNVKPDMSPAERTDVIDKTINKIEEKASAKTSDLYRFDVSTFDSGRRYYLFKYMKFEDIRLVYAPPSSIGKFGGDIDNWMWPRHTGDFSFFRFYISPDGKSTKYSKDNVPFHPKKFLHFTNEGVSEGDFNFILGYPGRTQRHRTSYSVEYNVDTIYPFNIGYYTDALNIINAEANDSEAIQITYANTLASLNNYLKNFKGMLNGIKRDNLIQHKQKMESEFRDWVNQNEQRKIKYGDIFPSLQQAYSRLDSIGLQDLLLGAMNRMVETYSIASTLDKWSLEKTKPNPDRENRYAERNLPQLKEHLKLVQREFTPEIDAQMMEYFLNRLIRLPSNLQLKPVENILSQYPSADTSEAVHQFVQDLYKNTELTNPERRMKIFDMSRKEMQNLHDPMLDFAMALRDSKDRLKNFNDWFSGRVTVIRPRFIQGLQQWQDGDFYPDANFTIRLTYGTVRGYSPRDAVYYDYITSIRGILQKNTGEQPFNSPQKLLDLINRNLQPGQYVDDHINTIPVDFLNTTDITGGNSGSPVLDARGRFIGIAFDGNWESISADWSFNPKLTRAIAVDARYILYILNDFTKTHYVLNELTVDRTHITSVGTVE